MADTAIMAVWVVGLFTAFVGVIAAEISVRNLLMHLRKHDLSTYARLGEPVVLSRHGSPLTQQYLRERRYLESGNERVRTWGMRYQWFVRVFFVGFAICVVALITKWLMAI